MAKSYNYAVIIDGVLYPANTVIEDETPIADETPTEPKKRGRKNDKRTDRES